MNVMDNRTQSVQSSHGPAQGKHRRCGSVFWSMMALSVSLWSCGQSDEPVDNFVEYKAGQKIEKIVSSGGWSVLVQDNSTAMQKLKANATKLNFAVADAHANDIVKLSNKQANEGELTVGFPIAALDKKFSFGSVITAVTDDTELGGRLKLSDLPSFPIRLQPERTDDDELYLSLYACIEDCQEDTEEEARIISIPVLGVDESEEFMVLDLSVLGEGLNLYDILTGSQNPLKVEAKSASVARIDFTDGTLVFDVETLFEREKEEPSSDETTLEEVTVTSRWYILSREEAEAENFQSRKLREEVGFFDTMRAPEKLVTRFATAEEAGKKVKYYLKNVPREYKDSFKAALDSWNTEFNALLGSDLIEYEFLAKDDPRHSKIITGDIRYNVIEWDLVNVAPYGGLGPSIASQITGQIYSANTLVQGPSIEKLYKSWFNVQTQARNLAALGRDIEAVSVLQRASKALEQQSQKAASPSKLSLRIGALEFDIKSQRPELKDEDRLHFYDTPGDLSYEQYMFGYFKELVGHEVGHNLGLRHNFKGNLGSTGSLEKGEVSRSIMEYLGRTERHLNSISIYDKMALAYGYAGKVPTEAGWFCTDEHVPNKDKPNLSAECSRDDLGADAYGFFKEQLKRAVKLIVGEGAAASVWSYDQMKRQVEGSVNGLSAYYSSAEETSDTWTNFHKFGERPTEVADIEKLVMNDLNLVLCGTYIENILSSKPGSIRSESEENLSILREESGKLMEGFGLDPSAVLDCQI